MATIEQIRAARALLDWSQSDLADHAGLSQTGIARIENGTNKPNSQTLEKIMTAFEIADIEFIGTTGVRKKTGEIKTLKGTEGFRRFMDDVYETTKKFGGEVCLHNAKPDLWITWLTKEWFQMHSDRMSKIKENITFKITSKVGEKFFISNSFAEYRWVPKEMFHEDPFYIYGNKIAFLQFDNDNVTILIFENRNFAAAFKTLFNVTWDNVAKKPSY